VAHDLGKQKPVLKQPLSGAPYGTGPSHSAWRMSVGQAM